MRFFLFFILLINSEAFARINVRNYDVYDIDKELVTMLFGKNADDNNNLKFVKEISCELLLAKGGKPKCKFTLFNGNTENIEPGLIRGFFMDIMLGIASNSKYGDVAIARLQNIFYLPERKRITYEYELVSDNSTSNIQPSVCASLLKPENQIFVQNLYADNKFVYETTLDEEGNLCDLKQCHTYYGLCVPVKFDNLYVYVCGTSLGVSAMCLAK